MKQTFPEWQEKIKLSSCVATIVEKETTEKRTANPRLKQFNYIFNLQNQN
jgi:hypothetical protein